MSRWLSCAPSWRFPMSRSICATRSGSAAVCSARSGSALSRKSRCLPCGWSRDRAHGHPDRLGNEEAVIYLQHKFARMGVDDALEKAGCRAGDEVRICQRAFDFEGAEDFSEYEELEDAGEDVAVGAIDVADAADEASRLSMRRMPRTMPRPRRTSKPCRCAVESVCPSCP